ncbi:ABC transporter permease [Parahaliea maris]|uniref:Transport permease protein n=1 Tax=Parahaliea maris TaxID=2716870 RepID=A0A5C9A265_9GAMM|nr:ABC transporter permease [Parahaliea maris]TXS94042.1 ABC transporter permease [Parahaliea maris]
MKSLVRILAVTQKEFLQLSRDRISFGMVVMIPLVQLLLFGYAINTEVRHVPIGIVDLSNSAAARVITEQVRVTQVVDIIDHYDTPQEAEQAVIAGAVRAVLLFPRDLPRRIASGDTVGQWLVDGSDTTISQALLSLRSMPLQLSAGAPAGAYQRGNPSFEVSLFFNPERRSAVNIVPGLTAIVLTMTMILFTALALVRERELGNMELLITTPIHPLELMVGKLVPYILVGLVQVAIILGLGHVIFRVPFAGGLAALAVSTLAFIAASLTLGLIISTVARSQLQAMQLTIFILLPSILLSGFMFPYEAMPLAAQWIAEAFPATHYIRLVRAVVLRGAETHLLGGELLWLGGFTVLGLGLATARFRKTLD